MHVCKTISLTFNGRRLGGPLVGLQPCPSDPALLLVRQADNTLRVVNTATMKVGG